jgi:glucose/mannose-6-phosphate isomerase
MIREAEAIDKSNMKGLIDQFGKQIQDARKLGGKIKLRISPELIIVGGMGGSGYAGTLLKQYLPDLNILVIEDYHLPSWVKKNAFVFVSSYSGNTEETLSLFQDAHRKNFPIVALSAGGKLEAMALAKNVPHIKLPGGLPPRLSTGYLFIPLLTVLQNAGLIPNQDPEIDKAIAALDNPKHRRIGEELSSRLIDRVPLIYGSGKLEAVARKWKIDLNENSKTPAFYNIYPEFNHNELNGFINLPARFHAIILRDEDDSPRIQKRMDITKKIIRETGTTVTELVIRGDCALSKLLSALHISLYLSYNLALAYGTDPTPVPIVEILKKELK